MQIMGKSWHWEAKNDLYTDILSTRGAGNRLTRQGVKTMRTQKEIDLFNILFEHYGNERDTWEAVEIVIKNNLTPNQVIEIF